MIPGIINPILNEVLLCFREVQNNKSGSSEYKNLKQGVILFLQLHIYVDIISPSFDHILTSTWTFFTLSMDKNRQYLTTYPPHLIHIVFEGPLMGSGQAMFIKFRMKKQESPQTFLVLSVVVARKQTSWVCDWCAINYTTLLN